MPGKHASTDQLILYQAARRTLGRAAAAEIAALGDDVSRRIDRGEHFQQRTLSATYRRRRRPAVSALWASNAALFVGEHPNARAVEVFEHLLHQPGADAAGLRPGHRRSFERWFAATLSTAQHQPRASEERSHAFLRAAHHGRFDAGLSPTGSLETRDIAEILKTIASQARGQRNKAIFALGVRAGISVLHIKAYLMVSTSTVYRWRDKLVFEGIGRFLAPDIRVRPQRASAALKAILFKILHEPPINYGFSRTNWRAVDLKAAMATDGFEASLWTIRNIVRAEGYRWRKARVSLTSTDPKYREKLDRMKAVLSNLGDHDHFFSVDEYGPFTIRLVRGRKLTIGSDAPIVPQWQRSKGQIIMTAALELKSNQITHFYSEKKNTTEMIKLIEILRKKHAGGATIFVSWDSASWHMSKKLDERIGFLNEWAEFDGTPRVELVPLPARAQFLNVIEAVFSGMSRAIIHNSDFADEAEAMAMVDGYIAQRNTYFTDNPRRAGNKIWGQEPAPAVFSDSSNCKDPRWR